MEACKALVETRIDSTKTLSDSDLLKLVPGPDFPTAASIMGTRGAKQLYTTGNGGIIMRAITEIEKVARGGGSSITSRTAIIVTELPYQVNKSSLLEKIAQLVNDKKLEGIADLRDESDRDGIRVVLELKRDAVPAVVLNNLYKKTPLQTSFSGNFLALFDTADGVLTPQRFTLREALDCFLDFRFQTIRRKTSHQLEKVIARAHIVDGLLLALDNVDLVIALIRKAEDSNAVKEALMADANKKGGGLGLSQEQADSVTRLQLIQLTRLNLGKLQDEKTDLENRRKELSRLLQVDEAVYQEVMLKEFEEMNAKFGQDRKTAILTEDGEVNEIDMIGNSQSGE